jgi:hypothetical protein
MRRVLYHGRSKDLRYIGRSKDLRYIGRSQDRRSIVVAQDFSPAVSLPVLGEQSREA